MLNVENGEEYNKEWIRLYSLSKKELETEIIRLSVNKKYIAHQAALKILSLENRKLIQLPVENASELIGASPDVLKQLLQQPNIQDRNTLVVATYELERSGFVVEKKLNFIKQVEDSYKTDVDDVGGVVGLFLGITIVSLIAFFVYICWLISNTGSLIKGLFF